MKALQSFEADPVTSQPGASAETVRHPIFARLYHRLSAGEEKAGGGEHRRKLLASLRGRVVEVGAGNGLNFKHYPETVDEVIAVEPEPYLRQRANDAARNVAANVSVVDGVAGRLPLDDHSVDAGVASLVLCSVPDQGVALAELGRVIRPGGELRFYEHVVAGKPGFARFQSLLDRTFWPSAARGCHCSRDTAAAFELAGFSDRVAAALQVHAEPARAAGGTAHPGRRPTRPVSRSASSHV